MRWVLGALGGGLMLFLGSVLRRLLRLDGAGNGGVGVCGWVRLTANRESVYESVALEIETQTSILGVSLNDAIEQRDLGEQEIAGRLVGLADCEWDRLARVVAELLNILAKYMSAAQVAVPVRDIAAHRFKCPSMVEYARMHELLDQFVFRYRLRFQLHVRVLRHAAETLTAEFGRTYRGVLRAERGSDGLWSHLDFCFHDFDLITKEALLAFRAVLARLPDDELQNFAADLETLVAHGVRTTPSRAARASSSR